MTADEIEALRQIVREEMVAAVVAGASEIAQALLEAPLCGVPQIEILPSDPPPQWTVDKEEP